MSSFSHHIANEALALSLESGEMFMHAIHDRLLLCYPSLQRRDLDFLNSLVYHTIQPFAWKALRSAEQNDTSIANAIDSIRNEYPWISNDNVEALLLRWQNCVRQSDAESRHSLSQTDRSWKSSETG